MERNEFTNTYIANYKDLNQSQLVALISKELNISEEGLSEEISKLPKGLYKKELTYWQVYDIAIKLKSNNPGGVK